MYKYIDIHAHLNFEDYDEDREEVFNRAKENETLMINVGTGKESSEEAVKLADQYENAYAIIGLHPTHDEDFDYEFYKELGQNKKVVGIGECGLDYFRLDENNKEEQIQKQKNNFIRQIELALELDKPLMIHCREAYVDVLEILSACKKVHGDKLRGNFHFYAGDIKTAQKILDLGFTMSFTGVITFAKEYEELVKFIPIEKIHSETDCPFVTPVPYRGKRNEPVYVKEVVKKIAEIKGLSEAETAEILFKNSINFYNII